jgi:hypothetical protein
VTKRHWSNPSTPRQSQLPCFAHHLHLRLLIAHFDVSNPVTLRAPNNIGLISGLSVKQYDSLLLSYKYRYFEVSGNFLNTHWEHKNMQQNSHPVKQPDYG